MDLALIRLNAHLNYLVPKIDDERKRNEFVKAVVCINNDEDIPKDKYGGADLAVDIYTQILHIHMERFDIGRTGDAYTEKL